MLSQADEPIRSLTPLLVLPEHEVAMLGRGFGSHTDAWVLASHPFGLASIAVEGKAGEDFGPTVGRWLATAAGDGENRQVRLKGLSQVLNLSYPFPDALRYQLLHRFASAVLEAKRFHANIAVCLVHSFGADEKSQTVGLSEFNEFCALYGTSVGANQTVRLCQINSVTLYAGWVCDTFPPQATDLAQPSLASP